MDDPGGFTQPLWLWLAAGGLLLVGELATGSSWLLWPAVSAALVGLLSAIAPIGLPLQLILFAVLTIVTTAASRTIFRKPSPALDDDVNDVQSRLLGRTGVVLTADGNGRGRVLVDGCEWAAEPAGAGTLQPGARVRVLERLDGARLRVFVEPSEFA